MNIYNLILKSFNKIKGDKIFVYSSHASFYLLISAIPFATLLITLAKQFVYLTEYDISNVLLPFFPKATQSIAHNVIKEVFYKADEISISFSLFSLLWTASRGIAAIRRGLIVIYQLSPQNFLADVLSGIALMLLLVIIIIPLFAAAIFLSAITPVPLTFFIGPSFLTTGFSLIYFLLLGRRFAFKTQIPGAFFSSISWIAFIRIFSFYIKHFSNYASLFGSLTAVFILALWVYFSTIIFFFGAELNIMISTGFFKRKRTV